LLKRRHAGGKRVLWEVERHALKGRPMLR
jgi:hypothetical protein